MDIEHFGSPKVIPLYIRDLLDGNHHINGAIIEYYSLADFSFDVEYDSWLRIFQKIRSDESFLYETPALFCVLEPRALCSLDILQGLHQGAYYEVAFYEAGVQRLNRQKELMHILSGASDLIVNPDKLLEYLTSSLEPLRKAIARQISVLK